MSVSVSVSREWREKGISKKTKKRETKKSGAERETARQSARVYVCCERKSIGGTMTTYMRTHRGKRETRDSTRRGRFGNRYKLIGPVSLPASSPLVPCRPPM